jgi:tetratricopeptide (TPR) repeat protein
MSVDRRSEIYPLKETLCPERPQLQYSVPLETVPSYTVRRTPSLEIEEKMHVVHKNSSVSHALAIHGLGGTGKTQLALKYVEDHKDKYNPILWIDAQDEGTVRSSFERCVSDLQLSVDRTQPQGSSVADLNIVRAVGRWLRERRESDDKWLVVIDNADDVTWGIKKVIPKGIQGSIIITSQDSQSRKLINGGCEELSIEMMEPLEARTLLLQHLKWKADSVPQKVCEDCDTIAKKLGHLALAVDLAGAYIGNDPNQGTALKQYLADYEKHQDELLWSDDFRGLSATDKTVWTVWDTTLKKIENRHADVRPGLLLAYLAHFNSGFIQDELFRLASLSISVIMQELHLETGELFDWLKGLIKTNGQEWDSFYYRKGIKTLGRYSLLQQTDGEWPGVSMHNLVQWRAKRYEQDLDWNRLYLVFVLAACRQLSEEAARPQFRRHMVTHIPEIGLDYLDDIGVDDEKKGFVCSSLSRVYYDEGRWKEAEELEVQVMETRKRVLGAEHPDTLTSMANLASTFWNQGRWKEAEELDVQVMETRKRVLGAEHPDTLTSMANLASTYRNQGRWKEAEELDVQVMETSSRVLGAEHPDTLTSIANLASTFWNQGRWKEAEELQVQVMETSSRVLGAEHPDTLTSVANLASTYRNQGRWKEAEELEVQVMEMRKRVLGAEHPSTLTSIANLASTFWNQGRWKEAEELDVQVMETRKRVLGAEHPSTLTSIANLASTFWNQGRWKEAEELEVQVMETSSRVLGVEHPSTLTSIANLALTYRNQGRWKEAEELEVQVMETRKRVLGAEHPSTLTSIANLASTYRNQGRWKEAEELDVQVMETSSRVLGAEHPDTLTSIANLASTFRNQGRWKEAEELQVRVIGMTPTLEPDMMT